MGSRPGGEPKRSVAIAAPPHEHPFATLAFWRQPDPRDDRKTDPDQRNDDWSQHNITHSQMVSSIGKNFTLVVMASDPLNHQRIFAWSAAYRTACSGTNLAETAANVSLR
jgi:hypothetical protein